jgi:heptosyltransferase I
MYSAGNTVSGGARILVIRLGAMGDIIHTLPAAASLKHSFPGSHLTWAVEAKWVDLLEGNPFVNRVVLLRRGNAAGLRESWRDLRAARYDFAVDFQGLIKSALVAAAARPDRIYGYDWPQVRERAAALIYSNRLCSQAVHMVDRHLELAAAAGAVSAVRTFPLPPGRPEGKLPDGGFVLACPLAGWRSKQWPLEHYRTLAAALQRELGLPLVLNGPPSAAAAFAGAPEALPHYSSVAGLIDATRRAVAVVGVDSGPLHLAAGLVKPGVAIFGPTDPGRNGPYGDSLTVLRCEAAATSYKRRDEIDETMKQISPEMVLAALKAALARSQSTGCQA